MTRLNPRCTTCRIRNCSLLKDCSSHVLEEISDKKKFRSLKKGDQLLIEGEDAKEVYFIQSGVAKVELTGKKGRPLILRLASEGAIFGHRVFGVNAKQPLTIVAVENLNVCQLPIDVFYELVEANTDLQHALMSDILNEMRSVELRTVQLVHKPIRERMAGILLHIAETYQYHPGGSSIHVHLDRQDIADLAGTTKEQVSKFLATFQQEKLIKFRAKHFKYFDFEGLRAIAAAEELVLA